MYNSHMSDFFQKYNFMHGTGHCHGAVHDSIKKHIEHTGNSFKIGVEHIQRILSDSIATLIENNQEILVSIDNIANANSVAQVITEQQRMMSKIMANNMKIVQCLLQETTNTTTEHLNKCFVSENNCQK